MSGGCTPHPQVGAMEKQRLKFADHGDPSLLVWRVASDIAEGGIAHQCFVLPVASRPKGLLIAVPLQSLSTEILLDSNLLEDDSIVGPSREFESELVEEPEDGPPARVGIRVKFLVVDVEDTALQSMRDYDPVTDMHEDIKSFADDRPFDLPELNDILSDVAKWLSSVTTGRIHFYSAREEPPTASVPPKKAGQKRITTNQIAEQLAALAAQVQVIASQQEALKQNQASGSGTKVQQFAEAVGDQSLGIHPTPKIPALSASLMANGPGTVKKVSALVGPPPKVRAQIPLIVPDVVPPDDLGGLPGQHSEPVEMQSIVSAISQQSLAITHLVSHLTSGDAIADLQTGASSGVSTSTKGVARREKMQSELAGKTSAFFLQVEQQLYKRMCPARMVPSSLEEIAASGASMTSYAERYGGFRGQRDLGLIFWIASHAMDAAASNDFELTKEYLAILMACLEQAAMDGNWNVAYVLSLLEEPPPQLFMDKMVAGGAVSRPFAPLVPPSWAATALSFLKEVELLATKKGEIRSKSQPNPKTGSEQQESPSPKRRPKFPKKPSAAAQQGS